MFSELGWQQAVEQLTVSSFLEAGQRSAFSGPRAFWLAADLFEICMILAEFLLEEGGGTGGCFFTGSGIDGAWSLSRFWGSFGGFGSVDPKPGGGASCFPIA